MEPLFLLLVSALFFAQGWHLLGFFPDARAMGAIAAALAVGLLVTASLGPASSPVLINASTPTVVGALRGVALLWAVYAAGLAAHGLWGFPERAMGFHALFLLVVSLAVFALPYPYTQKEVSFDAQTVLSAAAVVLAVLSALVFFSLAIPLRKVRKVTGWVMLAGSAALGILGFAVFFGVFDTIAVR